MGHRSEGFEPRVLIMVLRGLERYSKTKLCIYRYPIPVVQEFNGRYCQHNLMEMVSLVSR